MKTKAADATEQELKALQSLSAVLDKYPEIAAEIRAEKPELWYPVFEKQKELELIGKLKVDSADGFDAFYQLGNGFPLNPHNRRSVDNIYKAHGQGKGYSLNGFRGSWKSVTLSVWFTVYRIGLEPGKTNVIISANDDSSGKITKLIAQIIADHPGFKKAFPTVAPREGMWSENGYWVVDNSMTAEEWAKGQSGVIDPTFVGGGYTSTRINGKHPTGCLVVDDIHDRNNSLSHSERKKVVDAFTQVIMYTVIRKDDKLDTWVLNIGVPWADDDIHQVLKNSGGFLYDDIPAMVRMPEGEGTYIDGVNEGNGRVYEDIVGWWKLTWPEKFGVGSIMSTRSLGKFDFWQMVMMDIRAAKNSGLTYFSFPHGEIDRMWPTQGGADPSYTLKDKTDNTEKNSHFALAYLQKRPIGGAVLAGGVIEKCGLNEAAGFIASSKALYPNYISTVVENVGMGLLFLQSMRLINPSLVLYGSDLGAMRPQGERAGKAKSKHDRILIELEPYLQNGTILISDEDTPFLRATRDALDNFKDLEEGKADARWDALDALYHAAKAMPDVLRQPVLKESNMSMKSFSKRSGLGSTWNAYGRRA